MFFHRQRQCHQKLPHNHSTYHIAARRFPWSDPPPKKPRYLPLSFRSLGIIIMAGSNYKIKPIQVQSWMLYLNWTSKKVRLQYK